MNAPGTTSALSGLVSAVADGLWLAAHDSVGGGSLLGGWPLGVGLGAGLLAELALGGLVRLRDGGLVRTGLVPADPALWSVLAAMRAEERHRAAVHDVGVWLSFLAYGRAESLVVDRLAVAGLVRAVRRRRLWGGAGVRWTPVDSVVAGIPASVIVSAVARGVDLPSSGLVLAGLFLATGLHRHALVTLTGVERSGLAAQLGRLDVMSAELLRAADAAVGEAAMR